MIARLIMLLALVTAIACSKKDESKGEEPEPSAGAAEPVGKAAEPGAAGEPAAGDAAAAAASPAAGDPAAAGASAQPAAEELPPEVQGAGEIPTEQDFEEKAQKEVSADNLEAEVKKLEEELGGKPK